MKAKPKAKLTPAQQGALTRKRRAAGRKAATTRKRRESARKAALTRARNKRWTQNQSARTLADRINSKFDCHMMWCKYLREGLADRPATPLCGLLFWHDHRLPTKPWWARLSWSMCGLIDIPRTKWSGSSVANRPKLIDTSIQSTRFRGPLYWRLPMRGRESRWNWSGRLDLRKPNPSSSTRAKHP